VATQPKTKVFGCLVAVVIGGFILIGALMLFGGGRKLISTVWRGNVYSVGYRDVYIQGTSKKADTMTGLGRVYELKASHHGYGAGVDPTAIGQTPQGAWTANYFNDELFWEIQEARGDTMYRVFYIEKDVQVSSASNYEVIDIMPLPPPGEPMDDVVQQGRTLFQEYMDKE
jgi:hypothetical protein